MISKLYGEPKPDESMGWLVCVKNIFAQKLMRCGVPDAGRVEMDGLEMEDGGG